MILISYGALAVDSNKDIYVLDEKGIIKETIQRIVTSSWFASILPGYGRRQEGIGEISQTDGGFHKIAGPALRAEPVPRSLNLSSLVIHILQLCSLLERSIHVRFKFCLHSHCGFSMVSPTVPTHWPAMVWDRERGVRPAKSDPFAGWEIGFTVHFAN